MNASVVRVRRAAVLGCVLFSLALATACGGGGGGSGSGAGGGGGGAGGPTPPGPTPPVAGSVPYPIVYVRQPRRGDTDRILWPEVFHPATLEPGSDLVLLRTDGTEDVLVAAGVGAVTDPFPSFDAAWVYYAFVADARPSAVNTQRGNLPYSGSDIYRVRVADKRVERLTHGEFTPNTGMGAFHPTNPVDPGPAYDRLGYGVLNLGPCPVAGGKVAFVSNRNGFVPPKGFTHPTLQLFVMDEDGGNVTPIAPMTIGSALHPTPTADGRLMFSTYESQGLRDERMWGIWSIQPDGRQWRPVVSAFREGQAFHFQTQLSGGDLVVVDYYNLNNEGFGALYRLPSSVPAGEAAFYPARLADNPEIARTVGAGFAYPFRMPFTPKGLRSITPFTLGDDEAAPVGAGGARVGKFTHPSGAPGGDLLVVWTPGPANLLARPSPLPAVDAGLYVVPLGETLAGPSGLVLVKNDPAYNEAWPRALVPWSAVHGTAEPPVLPWLPNDGTVHAALPAGTPFGLVGTSSVLKRESFPGATTSPGAWDGLDAFNTYENGQSSNWGVQGAEAGRYADDDVWAIRLLAMEPNTHRSYGPGEGRHFESHANERLRILGELPVRKWNPDGSPVLDPEGRPDTSFAAKVPADTPFTFQLLDRRGLVLNMAQTWHQVRPGEVRWDCGGCHAHSQQPLAFSSTAASRAGYAMFDLAKKTPLLTVDAGGAPAVREVDAAVVDVEFLRDVRPILRRSCAPCHAGNEASAPGRLVLDGAGTVNGLPGDWVRLAGDRAGAHGVPSLVSYGWRQTNASRYVRMFQSRRSLLVWKVFGERLDGWTNADHPTESVPGDPSSLPSGVHVNAADLDFTGSIMPPPGGAPALTEDEKRTIARWVDLGCPLDTGALDGHPTLGWFGDDQRPCLTVSSPRAGANAAPVTAIRVGAADGNSGVDPTSLSIRADRAVNGRAAGAELADLAVAAGDGIVEVPLAAPWGAGVAGTVTVRVRDRQGNTTEVVVRFRVE